MKPICLRLLDDEAIHSFKTSGLSLVHAVPTDKLLNRAVGGIHPITQDEYTESNLDSLAPSKNGMLRHGALEL